MINTINILKHHYHSTNDDEFKKELSEAIERLSRPKKKINLLCESCKHKYLNTCQSRNVNIFFLPEKISLCDFYIKL